MLLDYGVDEKYFKKTKIKTYLTINFRTLLDKSTTHLAEMFIIASTMEITDVISNSRKYFDASKDIFKLLDVLKMFEEENLIELKKYL